MGAVHLVKTTFTAAQAKSVKLVYAFAQKSRIFSYRLSVKRGKAWSVLYHVRHVGVYEGRHTMTIKALFGSHRVKKGHYRLKLSADRNSKLFKFRVI